VGDPDGEIARVIRAHDCGFVVPAGDAAALVAAVHGLKSDPGRRSAMGARARHMFESDYELKIAMGRWRSLIAGVAGMPEK